MRITRVRIIVILLVSVIVIALAGYAKAYFTDSCKRNNTLTVGNVDIRLVEEKYNYPENVEKRKKISPNEKLKKDPKVTNVGKGDCYVFIEFTIPITFNFLVAENGQFIDSSNLDVANLKLKSHEAFKYTVDRNWVLVDTKKIPLNLPAVLPDGTAIPETFETKYVYAYATGDVTNGRMSVLKSGETTTCIFANEIIQYGNFYDFGFSHRFDEPIWRELFRDNFKIPVKAYAIQSTETSDGLTSVNPASVYNLIKGQIAGGI